MAEPVVSSYIVDIKNKKHEEIGIPLYLPDYSAEYNDWLERQNDKNSEQMPSTVIVIDI